MPAEHHQKREQVPAHIILRRYLVTGILVMGPVIVTIYLLWKGFLFFDKILSNVVTNILIFFIGSEWLRDHTIPGLGFITLLILLILAGFAARNVMGQWFFAKVQKGIDQIPLVNRVYRAVQQISDALFSGRQDIFKHAVLVEYPRRGIYSIGITTTATPHTVQSKSSEELVGVFLPTTPNPTSGFLLYLPRKDIIILDISVEDALKLVISAGTITKAGEQTAFLVK